MRGRFAHPSKKGGSDTGPSPVDRRKTASKHHLICDGRGTPLKVITTAANVNDVTQTLALVDGIPPIAGRPGRPRRRPAAPARRQGLRLQHQSRRTTQARDPARHLTQRLSEHQGTGRTSLRGGTDLRPAPPLQTPRSSLGTAHRTSRRLRLPRLQPHLLPTPQAVPIARAVVRVQEVLDTDAYGVSHARR
ncbi:transposase [Streptomyces sp. NPDC005791]|uniref:transposase n=1 Tax=Streptomyces sp. NPDC005791 TaxID=3364732 RepID=UPI0036C664B1